MTVLFDRPQIESVLAERARLLARPAVAVSTVPTVELVVFGAGNERYAIDAAFVHRVERCTHITPLPGAARHFAGIANLHGQIVPLLDLGVLLGSAACADPAFAVVLGKGRPDIAILAGVMLEMRQIPLDICGPAARGARAIVSHITADGIAVIDGAALITDPRLTDGENAGTPEENTR